MATRAKTKENRKQENKSRRTQSSRSGENRNQSKMSALDFLEQEHRDVERTFDEFDEAKDEKKKEELAQKICMALTVHSQIEEEIFYPEARKATGDNDLIDEAIVEHASAKKLIEEIEEMTAEDELFEAKVRVLQEQVKHHIVEEEEELFPELDRGDMDLDAVGERLAQRKAELLKKLENA